MCLQPQTCITEASGTAQWQRSTLRVTSIRHWCTSRAHTGTCKLWGCAPACSHCSPLSLLQLHLMPLDCQKALHSPPTTPFWQPSWHSLVSCGMMTPMSAKYKVGLSCRLSAHCPVRQLQRLPWASLHPSFVGQRLHYSG